MVQSKAELNNYSVLVTRPKRQAENLCQLLEQQGLQAIRFPTLEIVALDHGGIQQQLAMLKQYHWLIFISANAVNFALSANNGKIDAFKYCSIAAVGKATEKALSRSGLAVQLVPASRFNTEGLLDTSEMNNVTAKSCLIIRGKGGRETLANCLRMRGAQVDYLEVYSRQRPRYSDRSVMRLLKTGGVNAITMTSGEALNNLLAMIDLELHDTLYLVPIIVISKRLKEMAKEMGFKHIAVAKSPEDCAITDAVILSMGSPIN
jgi:uroporphyrinogen-III synthase